MKTYHNSSQQLHTLKVTPHSFTNSKMQGDSIKQTQKHKAKNMKNN
jgi:hypothetical protein